MFNSDDDEVMNSPTYISEPLMALSTGAYLSLGVNNSYVLILVK